VDEKTFQHIRLGCYITWAVVEPAMLVLIILYAQRVIGLLEGLG